MNFFERIGKLFTDKVLYGLIALFAFLPAALFVIPTMTSTSAAESASVQSDDPMVNIVSNREVEVEEPAQPTVARTTTTARPAETTTTNAPVARPGNYLSIPGKVSSVVVPVGLDASGAIDTPGSAVGMYNHGGATFLDGHSTGVFSGLSRVRVGDIVEFTLNSATAQYRVVNVATYFYTDGTNFDGSFMYDSLYSGGADGLNMMTCAGSPVAGTYSHRLVVFSVKI